MIIPKSQIRGVESQGRNSTSALAGVASARVQTKDPTGGVLRHVAKVSQEFIKRKEDAEYNDAITESQLELMQWETGFAAKEFFTADEVQGIPETAYDRTITTTDESGKSVETPNNNIPAYQVYPYMLANKMKGLTEQKAAKITNPMLRGEYVNRSNTIAGKRNLDASLNAANQQHKFLREKSDTDRVDAIKNGDKITADQLAGNFEGTDFEKAQRLKENDKQYEVWGANELIQIEDKDGIVVTLERLRKKSYSGALNEEENIAVQNKLQAKLNTLNARDQTGQSIYKAEIKQSATDMKFAMDNGNIINVDDYKKMSAALYGTKQPDLAIDLRRAYKKQFFVDEMYKQPKAAHDGLIQGYVGQVAKGNEAIVLEAELRSASDTIDARIQSDSTGLYAERNISKPLMPGEPGFFAESLRLSKEASDRYKIKSKPLSETNAKQLASQMRNATIKEKTQFIQSVAGEVQGKANLDAIFKQLDFKGAGNLNVYADILERGEGAVLGMIDQGRKYRQDKTLSLVPPNLANKVNVEMKGLFTTDTERKQYVEATMDLYAAMAYDAGDDDAKFSNAVRLDAAMSLVVGNVVEHNGVRLILPNNELNSDLFEKWVDTLSDDFITSLGGAQKMSDAMVTKGLRNGSLSFRPTGVRGEYNLTDVKGGILMGADSRAFILPYTAGAPKRVISTRALRRKKP